MYMKCNTQRKRERESDEPVTLRFYVEEEPVKSVFYKRPDKYSQEYQWDDFWKGKAHAY